MAHWADWIFCLVRTDPAAVPQLGISFLLIDLRTPGVTIQPIKSIEGDSHLNQVFFEDVRVTAMNTGGSTFAESAQTSAVPTPIARIAAA